MHLLVRVARLGTRFVLLLADDRTESHRLDEVRRDFVANISHELKTPIGAVSLLAEALESARGRTGSGEAFRAPALDRVGSPGPHHPRDHRALPAAGRRTRSPTPSVIDIDQVIAQAIDAQPGARPRRTASRLVSGGDAGAEVYGDETLLVTAVHNLIANAIQYSPDGSRVGVGVSQRDGVVEIAVTDQGVGIPEGERRPGVRALLPRRLGAQPQHRRHRPRPQHRQARRAEPRRRRPRLVAAGPRIDLHHPTAGGVPRHGRKPGSGSVTRILIVEDEPSLSEPLALPAASARATRRRSPATGRRRSPSSIASGADLVLLDLMLPGLSGTEVCRELRTRSTVPIIMLTAKDSEVDIVVGLELGADDYVTKPYSSASCSPASGRCCAAGSSCWTTPTSVARGGTGADGRRTALGRGRRHEVSMPLKEFELLEFLLRNAGRVLTRGQLIDRVWGSDYFGDTKTLDVHIKRIRSKIEADPSEPAMLVTVRGLGYRFEA